MTWILLLLLSAAAALVVAFLVLRARPGPVGGLGGDVSAGGGSVGGLGGGVSAGGGSVGGSPLKGRLLGTLQAGELPVNIRAGTGSGNHALNKLFRGPPFPIRQGGAILAFDVQFAPGFEWGCRGKIGGMGVGPGDSSGHKFSANGASARVMWDAGGGSYMYVYTPSGSESQNPPSVRPRGDTGAIVFQPDFRGAFSAGGWHAVELGIKLNAPGRNDGRLMLSVDGKTRVVDNVVMRLADLPIMDFGLGVFHGGPCKATRASSMALRNIRVYEWRD